MSYGGSALVSVLDRVAPEVLVLASERARVAYDVTLPHLTNWNYSPCAEHANLGIQQNCRRCGVLFMRHQRVAVSWMYLIKSGLLAHQTGIGKTISSLGLLAMVHQAGEMDIRRGGGRALVVCRPAALSQWQGELQRVLPSLSSVVVSGTRAERADSLSNPWEVALIGHQAYLRDIEQITQLGVHHLIVDDVDPIKDCDNKTAWAVKRMGTSIPRTIIMTATPLGKNLLELYDLFDTIGKARPLFGTRESFIRRYLRREKVTFYVPGGKKRTQMKIVGFRNVDEFKTKIAPISLRCTADDVDDLDLPEVVPNNVYLDLHPPQRERYDELATGVLRLLRESGTTIKQTAASAKMHYAAKICESLAILDGTDTPTSSVKFDWIVDKLLGDWSGEDEGDPGEKCVVFIHYKLGLEALSQRLDSVGIGNVRIWGEERDPKIRGEVQAQFWDDSNTRVLLGTTAIEQSLNLHCSRRLVNVDRIPNPGRMTQLAGRVRRGGSRFSTVYVHNLIAVDTHEERTLKSNRTEAAIASTVWDEVDVLHESLSPIEMLQLITPSARSRVA